MHGAPRGYRTGSIPTLPREARVTARQSTGKIRMGNGNAPDVTVSFGKTRGTMATPRPTYENRVGFAHTYKIDKETGFTTDVINGGTMGKIDDDGRVMVRSGTSAPNADDRRHPTARDERGYVITTSDAPSGMSRRVVTNTATGARTIVDDNENGGVISPRRVRTVADGDAPLPGVRMPKSAPKSARRANGAAPARGTVTKSDPYADVREFAIANGIPLEKIADKRVRAAIRDLIAHRTQVAAYAAK
jgi:hypothetical protein